METNLMRFLEISAQTFALASVWRSASSMVTPGTMINESLGFGLDALLPLFFLFKVGLAALSLQSRLITGA